MKKICFLFLSFICLALLVSAQAPNAIPYQGVARNAAGNILASQAISLRVSIHDLSSNGAVVFSESHSAVTNSLGLFNLNIGTGSPITATLSSVNWGTGAKFMQVEMDAAGGSNYTNMGTTQLMSVPYALYASNSANLPNGTANGNTMHWNGSSWVADNALFNDGTNVGIGTTAPAYKLDVSGDASFNGVRVGRGAGGNTNVYNTVVGNAGLDNNTSGLGNTAIGISSLQANTIGNGNTGSGAYSLQFNTSGSGNTGNGIHALDANTTGSNNTAIGVNANVSIGNLTNATAIGANAIVSQSNSLVLGNNANVGIGTSAPVNKLTVTGNADVTGNLGIGTATPAAKLDVNGDAFINGVAVGRGGGSISSNVITGTSALNSNSSGTNNTAIGNGALSANSTGSQNTVVGFSGGTGNTTGTANTLIGYNAEVSTANLTNATAIGANSIVSQSNSLVLGNNANVGIGTSSPAYKLDVADDASFNGVRVGKGSGSIPYVSYNTVVGQAALDNNTTGSSNTAIGLQALQLNTSGSDNTAAGYRALVFNTSGQKNTGNGTQALFSNSTGSSNTAIGYNSLWSNSSGSSNTVIGAYADVSTGNLSNATAIGYQAIVSQSNSLVLGNNANVGVGTSSPGKKLDINGVTRLKDHLVFNTANGVINWGLAGHLYFRTNSTQGDETTFIDRMILSNQGFLGINTGVPGSPLQIDEPYSVGVPIINLRQTTGSWGSGAIFDGYRFIQTNYTGSASEFKQFNVGAGGISVGYSNVPTYLSSDALYVNGNVGIGTTGPTAKLSVNGTANNSTGAWGVFSDARIKTITDDFTDGLNVIKKIQPVRFIYNENAPFKTDDMQIGVVAQQLEAIAPYMVSKNKTDEFTDLREVNNQAYTFLLINAVKEQQAQIDAQKKEIEKLKTENQERLKALEDKLNSLLNNKAVNK